MHDSALLIKGRLICAGKQCQHKKYRAMQIPLCKAKVISWLTVPTAVRYFFLVHCTDCTREFVGLLYRQQSEIFGSLYRLQLKNSLAHCTYCSQRFFGSLYRLQSENWLAHCTDCSQRIRWLTVPSQRIRWLTVPTAVNWFCN